jgi:hypothetical protein
MTDADKSLLVKVGVGIALFFLAKKVLGDLLSGLGNAVARPWGYGLTDAEQETVDHRFDVGVLFRPFDPDGEFADAPFHERQWVQQHGRELGELARTVADAPGYLNDDEEAVVRVFRALDSRYRVMWLARVFPAHYTRTLGIFGPDENPTLGEYLDAFLQPREWLPILDRIEKLPKYTS